MNIELAVLLAVAVPFIGLPGILAAHRTPNVREAVTLLTALALFFLVLDILQGVDQGMRPEVLLVKVLPGLSIAFSVEPLGALFAAIASFLWIITSIYSIGYMRGHHEKNQTRFYAYFAVAVGCTIGIAFSGNLFTLFIFYEALTLSTYPLVTHHGTPEAKRAGRVYLGILIGTSIAFQLAAIAWTYVAAGTLDFETGGILNGKLDPQWALPLLALYVFGIGKAAVMPFHRWLPAAMVAPTPVSALLHAVAVVKAGVFTVLKISVYIFGVDWLALTGAGTVMMVPVALTMILASLVAMTKDNLKARLAYSTVSQLSYVVLGAMLATGAGVIGSAMHIAMHAFGKITLFFCAGAILVATHKTKVSELDGLGRKMPFTFIAFLIGAICISGLPPTGGLWSKWHLMTGAMDSGAFWVMGVFVLSTLLNVAYLLPPAVRAFLLPPKAESHHGTLSDAPAATHSSIGEKKGLAEAPAFCVVPLCLTAAGCIILFFQADTIASFLGALVAPGGQP